MAGGGNSEKGLTLQDAPAAGGVTVERRANASIHHFLRLAYGPILASARRSV